MNGPAKNQISIYKCISLNCNKNIIGYSVENDIFDNSQKNLSKSQDTSFICDFDGKSIKNPKILPVEQIDNQNSNSIIMFNSKNDSLLYTVYYFDIKDCKIKINKVKNYIYEIKK